MLSFAMVSAVSLWGMGMPSKRLSKCLPYRIERLDFYLNAVVVVDDLRLSSNARIDSGQHNALQPIKGLMGVLRRHRSTVIALL